MLNSVSIPAHLQIRTWLRGSQSQLTPLEPEQGPGTERIIAHIGTVSDTIDSRQLVLPVSSCTRNAYASSCVRRHVIPDR